MQCKGLPASDSSQPGALVPPNAPGPPLLHPEVETVKGLGDRVPGDGSKLQEEERKGGWGRGLIKEAGG